MTNNGFITLTGAATHYMTGGVIFNNNNTIVDQATANLNFQYNSTLNNSAGAVIDFQTASGLIAVPSLTWTVMVRFPSCAGVASSLYVMPCSTLR